MAVLTRARSDRGDSVPLHRDQFDLGPSVYAQKPADSVTGNDTAYGGGGDDIINMGNGLAAGDRIDGGSGYDESRRY